VAVVFVLTLDVNAVQIVNPFSRQHHDRALSSGVHDFLLNHAKRPVHPGLLLLLLLELLEQLILSHFVVFGPIRFRSDIERHWL
jgi:hypothetical protein